MDIASIRELILSTGSASLSRIAQSLVNQFTGVQNNLTRTTTAPQDSVVKLDPRVETPNINVEPVSSPRLTIVYEDGSSRSANTASSNIRNFQNYQASGLANNATRATATSAVAAYALNERLNIGPDGKIVSANTPVKTAVSLIPSSLSFDTVNSSLTSAFRLPVSSSVSYASNYMPSTGYPSFRSFTRPLVNLRDLWRLPSQGIDEKPVQEPSLQELERQSSLLSSSSSRAGSEKPTEKSLTYLQQLAKDRGVVNPESKRPGELLTEILKSGMNPDQLLTAIQSSKGFLFSDISASLDTVGQRQMSLKDSIIAALSSGTISSAQYHARGIIDEFTPRKLIA